MRSSFILGKDFFLKLINIDESLSQALKTGDFIPFDGKEISITFLLKDTNLITPNTKVLVSSKKYNLADMEKYKNKSYQETYKGLLYNFKSFEKINENDKTGIIINEKLDGDMENFLNNNPDKKDLEDAFINIAHLYFELQKFKMISIDSKPSNYTWKRLKKGRDITYKFGDEIIVRKDVKNLFYLSDLEFVYSPEIIRREKIYNFSEKYDWMRDKNKIVVPRLSIEPYYDYNNNLLLGIDQQNISKFPRMFAIDILSLVKFLLTYGYNLSVSRSLQKYFTLFIAISKKEEEFPHQDYYMVSPTSFAKLFL